MIILFSNTRIMVFKGMVFKSKYWFWEKNKGFFLSEYLNFGELKGSTQGIQYCIHSQTTTSPAPSAEKLVN